MTPPSLPPRQVSVTALSVPTKMIRSWTMFLFLTIVLPNAIAINSVTPSKSCYHATENLSIAFTISNPLVGDTVGILHPNGTHILVSNVTCGQINCTNPPASGTVVIRNILLPGEFYKAVLTRSNTISLVTSSLFLVAAKNQTCPTSAPTLAPTTTPHNNSTTNITPSATPILTKNDIAHQALVQARAVIAAMVQATPRLTPQFLRMGFHDCIGMCDGCIDLTLSDNFGLENAVAVLDPVVAQFATNETGLSRADVWALAVAVGADVANHGNINRPISFDMNWFGRINCEDNVNAVCRNAQGAIVPCTKTTGPRRSMPSTEFNSDQVFAYFAREYGFDERQTVAIMGAHSVGRLASQESGIDGPNGWDFNNAILQHEYYQALLGGATTTTPVENLIAVSTRWGHAFQNNSGTVFPDRRFWRFSGLVMLNSDIALVRDLNVNNTDPTTGAVNCSFNEFTGPPLCPIRSTIQVAVEFLDNDVWLGEFKDVVDLMLTNGYNRNNCSSVVCPLTPKNISPSTIMPTTPPPTSPTLAPVTPTFAPFLATSSAPNVEPPVAPTKSSPPPTLTPVTVSTKAPSVPTKAPIIEASRSPTTTPATKTTAPIIPTKPLVTPTLEPISPTLKPVVTSTLAPALLTLKPVAPTLAPVMPSASPAVPTRAPGTLPTTKPATSTLVPNAATIQPVPLTFGPSPPTKPISPTIAAGIPTTRPVVPTLVSIPLPSAKPMTSTHVPVPIPSSKPSSAPIVVTAFPVTRTLQPTSKPSSHPTRHPLAPTRRPVTRKPAVPTRKPTRKPISKPLAPTRKPSLKPVAPTKLPTFKPVA